MTRSLIGSLGLHLLLLMLALLIWRPPPSPTAPAQAEQLTIRPVKLAAAPQRTVPARAPDPIPAVHRSWPKPAEKKIVETPGQGESKKSPPKKTMTLPKPNYPVRIPEKRPPGGGGEKLPDNAPAVPTYHPSVTLVDAPHTEWILARFQLEVDSSFEVEILEGSGDGVTDARALLVLKTWRWLPKRVDGEFVPSVEVVRLYRVD